MMTIIAFIKTLSVGARIAIIATVAALTGGITATTIILVNQGQPEEVTQFTQEEIAETIDIPFDEVEEKDDNLEEGKIETKQEGKNGIKTITYLAVFDAEHNEVSREKISEEITTEPQDKITVVGTRKKVAQPTIPSTTATKPANNSTPTINLCDPKRVTVECELDYQIAFKSRANYASVGGWEKAIQNLYQNYLAVLKDYGENYYTSRIASSATGHYYTSMQQLCFTSLTLDISVMRITEASWDDEPTPTCDGVRGEYPSVPSLDYLNGYFQRLLTADCYIGSLGELICRKSLF